jgi:hypothetical protein
MEDSSIPLIHLVESSPSESDLIPQMFIVSDKAEKMAETFAVPAGGKLSAMDVDNQHFAMCVRTLHEYSASDWSEFEEAEHCYRAKPWYYHALPSSTALPAWKAVEHGDATTK